MLPCYDKALKHITRYPKTKQGLKQYLQRKWYDTQEIADAVNKLQQQGFIDDKEYADSYMHGALIKKGKSRYQVVWKLLQKWISKEIIHELLEEHKDAIEKGVIAWATKYANRYKDRGNDPIKIKQKLFQRWYKPEVVNQVMDDIE